MLSIEFSLLEFIVCFRSCENIGGYSVVYQKTSVASDRARLAWVVWLTARCRQGQVWAAIQPHAAGRGGCPAPFHPLKIRTGLLSAALNTGCHHPPPASPRQVIAGLPDTYSDAPPQMPWQVADRTPSPSLGRNRGGFGRVKPHRWKRGAATEALTQGAPGLERRSRTLM